MKNWLLLFFCDLAFGTGLLCQIPDSVKTLAYFSAAQENGIFQFKPQLPPLGLPRAGAPAPFYVYHWEFGDGNFSADENPSHVYANRGTYFPILCATNAYDDTQDPPPKGKSAGILADGNPNPSPIKTVLKDDRQFIALKAIRGARRNEELVLILSYQNSTKKETNGELHFFYNEKVYPAKHFDFLEARRHFGELPVTEAVGVVPASLQEPSGWSSVFSPQNDIAVDAREEEEFPIPNTLVDNARKVFRDENTWSFPNMKPGEKRNMFLSVKGTETMLKDTSAIIHVKGIFVPTNAAVPSEEFTLDIEIVSSHDPNAILVSDVRVNYRLIKVKDLDYKVKFQNNGEGPAKKVEVAITIPEGLNKSKVKPVDWYPKCPVCPKEGTTTSCLDFVTTDNGIVFTFRNIYLPGSQQKGVADFDSTKGYVKYRIVPEKNMPKRPFRSQAKIVFDKNPPIYTNYSSTHFKKGFSPGPKVGYAYFPTGGEVLDPLYGLENTADPNKGYPFIGCTFSAYKPWNVYPQVELLTGLRGKTDLGETGIHTSDTTAFIKTPTPNGFYKYYLRDSTADIVKTATRAFITVEIPVSMRKNINRWLGVGLGGSAIIIFDNGTTTKNGQYTVTQYFGDGEGPNGPITWSAGPPLVSPVNQSNSFSAVRTRISFFVDINIGLVRAGPYLGIRGGYSQGGTKMRPFVQVSAGIKL
jgi:hypothetical protein